MCRDAHPGPSRPLPGQPQRGCPYRETFVLTPNSSLLTPLVHADPATDVDGGAIDEFRLWRAEEDDQTGDVLRFFVLVDRHVRFHVIEVRRQESRPGAGG